MKCMSKDTLEEPSLVQIKEIGEKMILDFDLLMVQGFFSFVKYYLKKIE